MSKRNRPAQPPAEPAAMPELKPEPVRNAAMLDGDPGPNPNTPTYERCPICNSGRGGTGKVYNSPTIGSVRKRYYKCRLCGHTWVATVTVEVVRLVEHRVVNIETRTN